MRGLVNALMVAGPVIAFGLWLRYRTIRIRTEAQTKINEDYRKLADEYRRLSDMFLTAQEHSELKLGEVSVRVDQVREQLESVQRILKEVE